MLCADDCPALQAFCRFAGGRFLSAVGATSAPGGGAGGRARCPYRAAANRRSLTARPTHGGFSLLARGGMLRHVAVRDYEKNSGVHGVDDLRSGPLRVSQRLLLRVGNTRKTQTRSPPKQSRRRARRTEGS